MDSSLPMSWFFSYLSPLCYSTGNQVTYMMNRLLDSLKVIIVFVIPGLFAFGLLFACIYALFFYQAPMG